MRGRRYCRLASGDKGRHFNLFSFFLFNNEEEALWTVVGGAFRAPSNELGETCSVRFPRLGHGPQASRRIGDRVESENCIHGRLS